MLRMNREKNNIETFIKKECANYNVGFKCSGVMIGEKLNQWINEEYAYKKYAVLDGKKCEYFELCLKPVQGNK